MLLLVSSCSERVCLWDYLECGCCIFVPVKRLETGDGMFFQWVYCAAIWSVSVVGDLILQPPKFHPFAMIAGVLWATGNMAAVLIVKSVGLSIGMLIWGSAGLLMGWAISRFGWFGIEAESVSKPLLNCCGAGLCLISHGLIFFFVKSDVELHPNSELTLLLIDARQTLGSCQPDDSELWIDSFRPKTRRFIGCLLAVFAGVLTGSSFVPILYIKSHSLCRDSMFYGASLYELDYVHALCSGIFVASTVYFTVYCAAMNNRPRVYARAVLPALLSGLLWALGTYCWYLSSNYLSAVVAFPIACAGSGLVAALWGSVVFREIKGLANCCIFFLASCIVVAGSLLTAFSKL
ncbi:transmembrane protein 144b [Thalassophryne amazonica]|uniref:transmembrane protein 144b n=1 Tax=Thalassophryne amazonica TaxID=390379 RepID=UPI001470E7EC|nr:transmembrane protein 144b [Thalassophryne amazonica]